MEGDVKIKVEKIKHVISVQHGDINKVNGVNSLILSVCLVDTLASFYCGFSGEKYGNKERYSEFVNKYLPDYKNNLYDIRCNLTHSFSNTLSNYMFIDDEEFARVVGYDVKIFGQPVFNIAVLKSDIANAIEKYFSELILDDDMTKKFLLRYNYLPILEDSVIPTLRNLKGEMVVKYNELDNAGDLNVKMASYDPTAIKQ